jgi:membrane-associated phospholipid phosphatase
MILLASALWKMLIQWDHSLFKIMNSGLANPIFDAVMPFLRNSYYWIPLYIFLMAFVTINFKLKGLWWIVFFLVTVALCDSVGTHVFKYGFMRIRPCNNPEFTSYIRLLVPCPSGYGFTSNHAANHFGMATFIFITFRRFLKSWALLAFLWAGGIAFAQVYVGVHYPSDIIFGSLLGLLFGLFTGTQFNRHFGLPMPLVKAE